MCHGSLLKVAMVKVPWMGLGLPLRMPLMMMQSIHDVYMRSANDIVPMLQYPSMKNKII